MPDIRVTDAIYNAIDEVNETLPASQRIVPAPETPLRDRLDSTVLTDLLAAVEEQIDLTFGRGVDLPSQQDLPSSETPLETLATLADYVDRQLRLPVPS